MRVTEDRFIIYSIDLPNEIKANIYNDDFTINKENLVSAFVSEKSKIESLLLLADTFNKNYNNFLEKIKEKNTKNLQLAFEYLES